WLADHDMKDKRVIDYGCGSGILGLAAACLGASEVIAVDIDPQALQATENNARQNGLESRVIPVYPGDDRLKQTDILLANILLNPLSELVGTFKSHLGEGGEIVLSGILAYQAEACMNTYSPWFEFNPPVFQDEWVMLSGVRNQVI
ncbi:MAG: 50S ribosomal protein L11 methyltransferase, partial [Gammaproteobacteria bacterium]